jgi:hypothetical protein
MVEYNRIHLIMKNFSFIDQFISQSKKSTLLSENSTILFIRVISKEIISIISNFCFRAQDHVLFYLGSTVIVRALKNFS